MTRLSLLLVMTTLSAVVLAGCATVSELAGEAPDLKTQADIAVTKAQTTDASLEAVLVNSAGHAVFPTIGHGARANGDTYNRGVIYEYGRAVGDVSIRQASSSLRQDGRAYTEIIVFQTEEAVFAFKQGEFAFDTLATAVAIKPGAAANAAYTRGVAVFTVDHSGDPYAASIGAQKFSYQPEWPLAQSPTVIFAGVSDR
jgi:hypothetical protein